MIKWFDVLDVVLVVNHIIEGYTIDDNSVCIYGDMNQDVVLMLWMLYLLLIISYIIENFIRLLKNKYLELKKIMKKMRK